MDVTKRNSALDITRITALFCVISVHFFLNNEFYGTPMLGWRMFVMTLMRTAFMICVPLFIMLTGYLMCRKSWSGKYYRGIVKTLGIYVLVSFVCLIYKRAVLGWEIKADDVLFGILNYSAANYAWYIEMYIGLFLLIPFLNAMWSGLGSKKTRIALLATLLALTSLPSVVNIFNFYVEGWWGAPILSAEYQQILPDWWTYIYPLTYYFLGAYLREYPVKLSKWLNLALWAASIVLFGAFNYYRSYGGYFVWAKYNDWYGLPNVVMTVLAFLFLSSRDTTKFPLWVKKSLAYLSDWCLGAYLLSFIFDNLIYVELNRFEPDMVHRLKWYPTTVLVVLIGSLAASCAINLIYAGIAKLVAAIFGHIRRKRTAIPMPAELPMLETERLILRAWRDEDAADMYAYACDPDVGPRAGWRPHASIEESKRIVQNFRTAKGEMIWALEHRESGRVIGSVGLHKHAWKELDGDLMLGYSLSKAYWGQGLMPEAAAAVVAYAFRELGVECLLVSHFDGNEQSKRVIEKLGFGFARRYERSWQRYDGELMNENVYTLSAAEHAKLRESVASRE